MQSAATHLRASSSRPVTNIGPPTFAGLGEGGAYSYSSNEYL